MSYQQTRTPADLIGLPSKKALYDEFVGKPLSSLRTPALVVDRAVFARNCARMLEAAQGWGARFRAHLKSHKTAEGTKLQLVTTAGQTHAVIVSTLMEAWEVLRSGLVAEGVVNDILYGMPIAVNKIGDISDLSDELVKYDATLRLHVDHPDQIAALEAFESQRPVPRRWSVFVKVDCGDKRAGIPVASPAFENFLSRVISSPAISIYGFYSHQGGSYASTSLEEASRFLSRELEAVNTAASLALAILSGTSATGTGHSTPFVLSVGSTPTTHAATAETRLKLKHELNGVLELHAGNYPLLDLQQLNTSLITPERISQRVLATVVSYYPGRGANGEDEALIDAGAIAMSKDGGPIAGYGEVIGKKWRLSRVSQEHGILTKTGSPAFVSGEDSGALKIGEQVQIIGQHACLIFAAHPWIYVTDSERGEADTVVDVWVSWKGW